VHSFCSVPTPTAPSLHARGRLSCIRTRLRKRTESAVSLASRVGLAPCYSCLDLRMDEGSSSCLAAPWLHRARHAQPSPSLRSFSFRFAMPHSHLHLREDRGLPVLGPCLPLPSPQQPPTSITRDPAAPMRIRPQPSYCSSSRTARDLPAHRRPACRATAPPLSAAGHALALALPRHICTYPSRAHPRPAPTSQARLHFSRG
jgi:hypothetical protein